MDLTSLRQECRPPGEAAVGDDHAVEAFHEQEIIDRLALHIDRIITGEDPAHLPVDAEPANVQLAKRECVQQLRIERQADRPAQHDVVAEADVDYHVVRGNGVAEVLWRHIEPFTYTRLVGAQQVVVLVIAGHFNAAVVAPAQ
jgi:hypothetical protein